MNFRKNLTLPLFFLIAGLCAYIFIFSQPKEDYHSINVAGANWGNLEVLIKKQEKKLEKLVNSSEIHPKPKKKMEKQVNSSFFIAQLMSSEDRAKAQLMNYRALILYFPYGF